MNIIPFRYEHVEAIDLQAAQKHVISHLCIEYLKRLEAVGPAVTAELDGRIIGCGGVAFAGFGMGTLWAFLAADAGSHFVRLHRVARRVIEIPRLRRIEATTEACFTQGCRWLELLGFHSEGVMRKYGPDGSDHVRYARV